MLRRFAYRLAKELGIWDVYQMLEEMTWRQFIEWFYYSFVEPFSEERADLRHGVLSSLIFNVNRGDPNTPAAVPSDFIPKFEREPPAVKQISKQEWGNYTERLIQQITAR